MRLSTGNLREYSKMPTHAQLCSKLLKHQISQFLHSDAFCVISTVEFEVQVVPLLTIDPAMHCIYTHLPSSEQNRDILGNDY